MTKRFLMLIAGALLALSPLFTAADALAPPLIRIDGIHSPRLTLNGMQVLCRVYVNNPNRVALPVTDADIDLKLSDVPAAKGRLIEPVTIPSRGQKTVNLLVDVAPEATLTWLPLFMGDETFTVPFQVDGYVDVDNAQLGRVLFSESGDVAMTEKGLVVR